MATINEISNFLEGIAPLSLQESYDNSGLLVGKADTEVKGIIISLDSTEDVIDEAKRHGCNLVIAHHPIIFSGLKRLNGINYIERTIISAIKNDIAIYAIHTNLDNVALGVNRMIGDKLGLKNLKILSPRKGSLRKLVTFCPLEHAEAVRKALFDNGAGDVGNYDMCSFNVQGKGTFRGNDESKPFIGQKGRIHTEDEFRIEVIFEAYKQPGIIRALFQAHPYEEVAYDIYRLENENQQIGSGMIGELSENQDEIEFLKDIKHTMKVKFLRHTQLLGAKVSKVAVCGGSGSFLLPEAIREGAQVFITADFKYHQFFDADKRIIIADIGHYESEQFTIDLIKRLILEKFSTFAVRLTEVNTNPVHYL